MHRQPLWVRRCTSTASRAQTVHQGLCGYCTSSVLQHNTSNASGCCSCPLSILCLSVVNPPAWLSKTRVHSGFQTRQKGSSVRSTIQKCKIWLSPSLYGPDLANAAAIRGSAATRLHWYNASQSNYKLYHNPSGINGYVQSQCAVSSSQHWDPKLTILLSLNKLRDFEFISYPILSLGYPILSYRILSYLIFILSYFILSLRELWAQLNCAVSKGINETVGSKRQHVFVCLAQD